MLKRGEADGLAVVKLDRLTRSVADWQTLIDGWFGERAGKQLFSVGDSIDTRTAAGRLVLNVLMSVAAWDAKRSANGPAKHFGTRFVATSAGQSPLWLRPGWRRQDVGAEPG